MVKEMHYQENTLFDVDPKVKVVMVTQNVAQYPWHHVTYVQAHLMFLHSMVKEKMQLQENTLFTVTLWSRSHEMLPSTFDIMWSMHQQSLILLHPTVKEKMT